MVAEDPIKFSFISNNHLGVAFQVSIQYIIQKSKCESGLLFPLAYSAGKKGKKFKKRFFLFEKTGFLKIDKKSQKKIGKKECEKLSC